MTAYETLEASGTRFKSWQGAAKYLQQKGFSRAKATQAAKKWFNDQTAPEPTPVPTPEPTPTPTPEPEPPPPGLSLLRHDPCTNPDSDPLWNSIDAAHDDQVQHFASGGPSGKPYRRCEIGEGDVYTDSTGAQTHRCELGYNTWRTNSDGSFGAPNSTFYVFKEGQRRVVEFWIRVPSGFPLSTNDWQVVTQIKQAGPANASGGSPVISLEARQNQLQLHTYGTNVPPKAAKPLSAGSWHKVTLDILFTVASSGKVKFSLNDSPAPEVTMQTLKPEVSGSKTEIPAGKAIPSTLRIGLYHKTTLPPAAVDFADIRVSG